MEDILLYLHCIKALKGPLHNPDDIDHIHILGSGLVPPLARGHAAHVGVTLDNDGLRILNVGR